MSTCVDVSGAKYPSSFNGHTVLPMEGMTLVPAITGKKGKERLICVEHEGNYMARSGDWKMVVAGFRGDAELYNIRNDRSEQHDLAEKYPQKLSVLKAEYDKWAERCYVLPWDKVGFPGSKSNKK